MKRSIFGVFARLVIVALLLSACQATEPDGTGSGNGRKVLAVESFLADMAQNVAGDRLTIDTLVPLGMDPHAFEPTPRDVARITESQVLILNGAGFEEWLEETIAGTGGERVMIESASGLTSRAPREGEEAHDADEEPAGHAEGDPHFWLDPNLAIRYVENIRDGLSAADPEGEPIYRENAGAYIEKLRALDGWIRQQVDQVPPEKRRIVTNHESFGYFADRYGFQIIGTVIPSVSSGASPSAQQMARLVDQIRASGATVIFLETGSNPRLADQIAQETGITVVSGLHTHSITGPDGPAPTYIDMMRSNVTAIVEALK